MAVGTMRTRDQINGLAFRQAESEKTHSGGKEGKVNATIEPIETPVGTRYAVVPEKDKRPLIDFPTVTQAQIFCLQNDINFKPWN